jgi:hypothetical protein
VKKISSIHLPGSKVIQAFHKGFETRRTMMIVKLDADLIFQQLF